MATIFDNVLEPFDPVKQAQQYQTLFNSQLAGQGQQIANDTNQTALQQQKYANLQRLIAGHLADPNATKGDVMDSIQRGLKLGLYTPQQASQAAGLVGKLDDTPNAIHQHLAKGLATLIDAQTALQNTMPSDGPVISQGSTTTYTQRSPLFSANPGQINPIISSQQGLSPDSMAQSGMVNVPVPTGRLDENGKPVIGADGRPEVSIQSMPMTKARELGLIDPALGQQLTAPPPPSFGPSGRNSLGAQPPRTGNPEAGSRGYVTAPSGPAGAAPGYNPRGNGRLSPYTPQGAPLHVPGTPYETPYQGGGAPALAPPSTAPGVVQPATPVSPAQNNPLALPPDINDQIKIGREARLSDQNKIADQTYQLQKQGLYSVNKILADPKVWTGQGQGAFNKVTGWLTTVVPGFNTAQATNNDALAHALAQATGLSGTDAQTFITQLAGGSPETAKPALQELTRVRLAERLHNEAAVTSNKDAQAQDYVGAKSKFIQQVDPLVFKLGLHSPTEQQAIIKSLPPAKAAEVMADWQRMKKANLLGTDTGSSPQ